MSGSRRRRGSGASPRAAAPVATPATRARKGRSNRNHNPTVRMGPEFWGLDGDDAPRLGPPPDSLAITSDPSALVRSLGRPPLGGHEVAAEHYLRAVYDRAVNLATALAAVGDLIEPDEPA